MKKRRVCEKTGTFIFTTFDCFYTKPDDLSEVLIIITALSYKLPACFGLLRSRYRQLFLSIQWTESWVKKEKQIGLQTWPQDSSFCTIALGAGRDLRAWAVGAADRTWLRPGKKQLLWLWSAIILRGVSQ